MTKEYLKMADVFVGDVIAGDDDLIRDEDGLIGDMQWPKDCAEYAAHAINSHDELVEQNENMKLRINQLLSERNATGVAIENALNGVLPEQHSMINRLQMIAGVAANRDELVTEVERLRESNKRMAVSIWSNWRRCGVFAGNHENQTEAFKEQYLCQPPNPVDDGDYLTVVSNGNLHC